MGIFKDTWGYLRVFGDILGLYGVFKDTSKDTLGAFRGVWGIFRAI